MFEQGLIVTATDTGVGKTFVAAGLLCALRKRGLPVLPMKPVQTGAGPNGRSPDLDFALAAAKLSVEDELYQRLAPYRLAFPASPHLAAQREGLEIDPSKLRNAVREIREKGHPVVIEAAGGLLVPLNENLLQIDLLREFDLPFVLVARAGLGTLNHTLLSVEALRARGATLARIYLNQTTPESGPIEADNARILGRLLPTVSILRIPWYSDPNPQAAAGLFSASGI